MRCHAHSHRDVVATCQSCGRGLCEECAQAYNIPLCISCAQAAITTERSALRRFFVISVALFALGLLLGLPYSLGSGLLWGYFLAGIPWGWRALTRITPSVFLFMPIGGWAAYFAIKLALSSWIGGFALPYYTYTSVRRWLELRGLDPKRQREGEAKALEAARRVAEEEARQKREASARALAEQAARLAAEAEGQKRQREALERAAAEQAAQQRAAQERAAQQRAADERAARERAGGTGEAPAGPPDPERRDAAAPEPRRAVEHVAQGNEGEPTPKRGVFDDDMEGLAWAPSRARPATAGGNAADPTRQASTRAVFSDPVDDEAAWPARRKAPPEAAASAASAPAPERSAPVAPKPPQLDDPFDLLDPPA